MDCTHCGGKMTKFKYLKFEEIEAYISSEYKSAAPQQYEEWLMSLNENDVVLTILRTERFDWVKEKYYLRMVEKTTKNGLKLRWLSKIFKYSTGETAYGKKGKVSQLATYKIMAIDNTVYNLIREYCENEEQFDIDKLNKIITNTLQEKLNSLILE